jgi:tRNA 2-selenouridine synthase
MAQHYDPAYSKSRDVHEHEVIATLDTDRLDNSGQAQLASRIAELISER